MSKKFKEITKIIWQHKIVEYLAYLAVILVPLYIGENHFLPFNSTKLIIMMGISLMMIVFFLWGNWKINDFKIRFSFLNAILLFFVLILTISSIYGIDPINSFFGWRNIMPLVVMYALVVFALILGSLIKKDKKIIVKLLSVSLFVSVITIIIFYTGLSIPGYTKEGSTLGNSSYLGGYILFNFFFGLGLFLYSQGIVKKILVAIASLFIIVNPLFISKEFLLGKIGISEIIHNPVSILGIANGAIMGIGISLIFICFLFMFFSKRKVIKITGLVLILVLFFSIFFVGSELVSPNTKLHKIFVEEKSGNRFLAWDIAKQGFLEHSIIGNGYNNYIYNYQKYYNLDFYKEDFFPERLVQPHNVVWEFASNTGILGLIGYLGLIMILFVSLYNIKNKEENKKLNNIRIILAGLLFGYFIQNLFVFDTVNTYLMLFIVIAITLGITKNYEWNINKKYIFLNKIFIVLGILFSLYMMQILVFAPWSESKSMKNITGKTIEIRNKIQEKSIFGGIMDDTFQAETLLGIYKKNLSQITSGNKIIFLKEIDSVVDLIEKDVKRQPYYSESYSVMAKLLNLYIAIDIQDGEYIKLDGKNYNKEIWNKSFNYIKKSLELNPNNPSSYLILVQLYLIKGDFEDVTSSIKKSLTLAPQYIDIYNIAKLYIKIHPDKDFEKYINEMEKKYITS